MGQIDFSERQLQVASLAAAGYTNREIGTELNLSEQVVKNLVHSLFDKIGVWNRVELANYFSNGNSRDAIELAQARIEHERLTVVSRLKILDTSAEHVFDELTTLAVNIFQVPIALLVLVDSARAWFKSNIGLNISEVPREISICNHTIQQSKVFVVPDALKDERFSCIPPVVFEPKVRFYAAAPILTEDGYALGVVCIVDRVPRRFTSTQLAILQSLARVALQQLQLRRQLIDLRDSKPTSAVQRNSAAALRRAEGLDQLVMEKAEKTA